MSATVNIGSGYIEEYSKPQGGSPRNGPDYVVQKGAIPDINGEIIFKLPQKELLSGLDDIRREQFLIFFIALLVLAIPLMLHCEASCHARRD